MMLVGYMIGPKNKGLNSMFTMMNLERIVVGIQGLGISEIAYQNSLSYCKREKTRTIQIIVNQQMLQIILLSMQI